MPETTTVTTTGTGSGGPPQLSPQPSRLVAVHQYAIPLSLMFMGFSTIVLVICAGYALIIGVFEAASFVAVAGQFFGLVSSVVAALMGGNRGSAPTQRSTDPSTTGTPGAATATATVTTAPGGTTP